MFQNSFPFLFLTNKYLQLIAPSSIHVSWQRFGRMFFTIDNSSMHTALLNRHLNLCVAYTTFQFLTWFIFEHILFVNTYIKRAIWIVHVQMAQISMILSRCLYCISRL